MNFDQQIKDWVQLDNQLKMLNEKVKELHLIDVSNEAIVI